MAKAKPAEIGSNSGINKKYLTSVIDRIERLEIDAEGISDDIKDIYTEAKGKNYDVKVIRHIVKQRKKDREQLRSFKELTDHYLFYVDPELAEVLS